MPVPEPIIELPDGLELVENTDRDRFELWTGGTFLGLEGYEIAADGTYVLLHTVIEEEFGRKGIARALVARVLDLLRERGIKVRAVCTYVQDFVERFPDYKDLLVD